MRSYLKQKIAAPVKKTEINGRGGFPALTTHPPPLYPQKLALKFANKRRSSGWYGPLADSKPRSFICTAAKLFTFLILHIYFTAEIHNYLSLFFIKHAYKGYFPLNMHIKVIFH
jgi:hypothetical protein